MIIFCFLGVGPPCCSILCQFWLCEEAQCVYLRRHLGSPIKSFLKMVEDLLCASTTSGTEDTVVSKTNKNCVPYGAYNLLEEDS